MSKPVLAVEVLMASNFQKCAIWQTAGESLTCVGDVPDRSGVYVFVLEGRAVYVGLASSNLAKRLYFYQRPGAGQSTNIRLNALILRALSEAPVDVYCACPPNLEWSGLVIRGPEGLEAGMIATFDLPWNHRGSGSAPKSTAIVDDGNTTSSVPALASYSGRLIDQVENQIRRMPRQTEAQIARQLFGTSGYQQKVNPVCRKLVAVGRVRRLGSGGPGDPYTYVGT